MPYRDASVEWVAVRIAQIANQVNELDLAIAAWARSLPDGTSAPPEVVALYERKEALMRELDDLQARFSSPPGTPRGSR